MRYKECYECKRIIPLETKGNYCDECRNKYMNHKEKMSIKKETKKIYDNNAWKSIRVEALKRSGYRCEVCEVVGNITQATEVHHITKVADGDNSTHYDIDNLICVCDKCHKRIEGMDRQRLLEYLEGLQG